VSNFAQTAVAGSAFNNLALRRNAVRLAGSPGSSFPQPAGPGPPCEEGGDHQEVAMKIRILYVVFVLIGALIATGIGYYVEIEFSSAAGLIVFLALFFANFVVSWIAVVLVIDGAPTPATWR
jgi:hypothetical protein